MKEVVKYITNIVVIILLVALVTQQYMYTRPNPDDGTYTFCVMWEGGITRENIIWKAYDFNSQKVNWDWNIEGYEDLVRTDYETVEEIERHICVQRA